MTPNDIKEEFRTQPFVPKRIFVSDGSYYDVYHPDMCLVGMASIIVGLTNEPYTPYFERTVRIDCRHVTCILPLPVTIPPAQNGPPPPQ